ncbi:MAG: PepSY domain-containing protein [Leptolyngbyaceae cyanobacterium RU_5_1]|nr:PepSY domain-containing protein [Leptolyngbyaceae cyanobacterium RU_5_1]
MNPKTIRNTAFHLHRWLGLISGVLLCIAGLTGSVLVFWHEIDHAVVAQRFGHVIPTGEPMPIAAIANTVKTAYAPKGLTLSSISLPEQINHPGLVWLHAPADHHWQVFVNPYTGLVMGDREWESSWVGIIYELHYKLLAGEIGLLIMGIVALLTLVLSITGIVLWPGWRKLIAGFKIKSKNAHIKRTNFDIHKVAGIITAIFLAFIGFTGFAWNVPQAKVTEAIYAATLTSKPADPVSKPLPGKQPLPIAELIQRADGAVLNATTTYVSFPEKPEEPFRMGKRQAQETDKWGNTRVYLDQFTGEVIQLSDGLKPSRAEAIINQFGAVHFGTFGGVPTKILYVFVGLAPTVLMVTGVVMWWYRKRNKTQPLAAVESEAIAKRF